MPSPAGGAGAQIVTFYSYKGGTGRTMLLANVAWIVASNGYKVLLIDWDLEAPGLHLYLRPFLIDTALHNTPGIIDFVWDAAKKIVTPIDSGQGVDGQISEPVSLENYITALDYEFPGGGLIDFIPAGRQSALYAQRVNTFDWENFYTRLGGGKILQAARNSLRNEYDFVLIDSRTGVSDTSSICTVQLPDKIVICFTLNRQSIGGAGSIAESIREQKGRQFKIFPVPTRLENAETDKRDAALRFARTTFRECVAGLQGDESALSGDEEARYWADVQVPYRTFYAFEEIPAVFKDVPLERGTILDSSENIASRLIGRSIRLVIHDPGKRAALASAFSFDPRPPAEPIVAPTSGRTIFLAKPASDMKMAYMRLVAELHGKGFNVVPDVLADIPSDLSASEVVRSALSGAEASIHLVGQKLGFMPEGLDPIVRLQLAMARERAGAKEQAEQPVFRRLIWAPKVLDYAGPPEEERDPLRVLARADRQVSTDKIDGDVLPRFIEYLFQYLAETAPRPALAAPGSKLEVYLAFHGIDEDYAGAIATALRDAPMRIQIPVYDSDPEARRYNDQLLAKSDVAILVWGNASEVWLRSEADRLSDWQALGRREQFAHRILVVGPPATRRKRPETVRLLFQDGQFDSIVDLVEEGAPTRELLGDRVLDWLDPARQAGR